MGAGDADVSSPVIKPSVEPQPSSLRWLELLDVTVVAVAVVVVVVEVEAIS